LNGDLPFDGVQALVEMNRFDQPYDQSICLNCGHQPLAAHRPVCGQRAAQRLTTAGVLRESLGKLLELDFGLLRTLRGMALDPGRLAAEYLAGRRLRYFNPLKFAFLMTTLDVAVILLLDVDVGNFMSANQAQDQFGNDLFHFVVIIRAYLLFFIALPVAWIAPRILRRTVINSAEFYCVFMYYLGFNMGIDTLFAAAGI